MQPVQAVAQADVAERKDVETVEREDQEHLGRPAADAGQGVEPLDRRFVIELLQHREVQRAVGRRFGQCPQPPGLGVRQSAAAQGLVIGSEEVIRQEPAAGAGQCGNPGLDGVGGLYRQLLADDRAAQHVERVAALRADRAGTMAVDQPAEARVDGAQMGFGGTHRGGFDHRSGSAGRWWR